MGRVTRRGEPGLSGRASRTGWDLRETLQGRAILGRSRVDIPVSVTQGLLQVTGIQR